ncbi:MAG: hypothetical protein ACRDJU_03800, partial [Actinomycetota bacterium]
AAMSDLWDPLAGQARASAVLRAAAERPGDAYLLTGPAGAGKEAAALAFAAATLCRSEPRGCGTCAICSRVLRGIHPDVAVLEPEGYTYPIEAIREAVATAALTPMEGDRRVVIVNEADRIAERSQNALLKALEEPNPSVTWVLVASLLAPVLPTIVSRCQLVGFAALAEADAVTVVHARSSLPEASAVVAVRAARGEVDRAVALVEDPSAASLRILAIDAALEAANPPDGRRALAMAGRVAAAGQAARQAREAAAAAELAALEEALGNARGSGGARRRLGDRAKRAARRAETDVSIEFCRWLAQAYRDLAALEAGAPGDTVTAPDRLADLTAAARTRPLAAWLRLAGEAMAAQDAIRTNASPALSIESVLLAPLALSAELGEPLPVPR